MKDLNATSKTGQAGARSLTNRSKDDFSGLEDNNPTLSGIRSVFETGRHQPIEIDAPPTSDQDQPIQEGLTGQEGEEEPGWRHDQPRGCPPMMRGTVDHMGPTASFVEEGATGIAVSDDGPFVEETTTIPGTMVEVMEVVKTEATCPSSKLDFVHDHEMLEEPRTTLSGGSEECVTTTPSVVRAGNQQSGKTASSHNPNASVIAPPAPETAWVRPANGKPDQTRPANQKPSDLGNLVSITKRTDTEDVQRPQVCTYQKGGICNIHGAGAKLRWKPVGKKVVGKDLKRLTWYECKDIGTNGKKLKQSKITLAKPSKDENQGVGEGH